MSHVAVRLVADWLADPIYGINSVAESVPKFSGDTIPAVTIYDETRDARVAQQQYPRDGQYPAVLVFLSSAKYDTGVPDSQDTGARTIGATVQVVAHLVLQNSETDEATTHGMYLLRALYNSLLLLDDPARDAQRTALGVRLAPSSSISQGQIDAPVGDNLVSAGACVVTYDTTEVTVLT